MAVRTASLTRSCGRSARGNALSGAFGLHVQCDNPDSLWLVAALTGSVDILGQLQAIDNSLYVGCVDHRNDTSGSLLRQARVDARLSQTELAKRARVTQSVISAYESDRREPAMSTLSKLVEATGHHLVVNLERDPAMKPGLPDTPLGRRLRRRRSDVLEIAQRHGATNVRVFGSVARGQDAEESDIDLMVDLDPGIGLVSLAALQRELTDLLNAHVDVIPSDSVRPRVKARADAESIPL